MALEAAFHGVVARHEILRTRFALQDGVPVQWIDVPAAQDHFDFPAHDGRFACHDLRALPAEAARRAADTLLDDAARAPFDLARGPLLRAVLVTLADDEHEWLVSQHHIVTDGWSTGLMARELGALYTAALAQRGHVATAASAPALPVLALQYADYAAWQRTRLDAPAA